MKYEATVSFAGEICMAQGGDEGIKNFPRKTLVGLRIFKTGGKGGKK